MNSQQSSSVCSDFECCEWWLAASFCASRVVEMWHGICAFACGCDCCKSTQVPSANTQAWVLLKMKTKSSIPSVKTILLILSRNLDMNGKYNASCRWAFHCFSMATYAAFAIPLPRIPFITIRRTAESLNSLLKLFRNIILFAYFRELHILFLGHITTTLSYPLNYTFLYAHIWI